MTTGIYAACAALAWWSDKIALAIIVVLPALYFLPERKLVVEE